MSFWEIALSSILHPERFIPILNYLFSLFKFLLQVITPLIQNSQNLCIFDNYILVLDLLSCVFIDGLRYFPSNQIFRIFPYFFFVDLFFCGVFCFECFMLYNLEFLGGETIFHSENFLFDFDAFEKFLHIFEKCCIQGHLLKLLPHLILHFRALNISKPRIFLLSFLNLRHFIWNPNNVIQYLHDLLIILASLIILEFRRTPKYKIIWIA